ncbi:MAG: dihydroorotate dehydrogenase [Planctomycetes bacterium]|nr:dihydroorotate dehydrogenase [Planctomycetota bacterium]
MKPDTKVKVGPLTLKNPVIVASGTFGYGAEFSREIFANINKVGGFITKTITLKPRRGNPPPRIVETPCGIINSIGLENPGLERFCADYLPYFSRFKTARIVSVGGEEPGEFNEIIKTLARRKGIDGFELNISCPNIKKGGVSIAQSPDVTRQIVSRVRRLTGLPLIAKLSPKVTDISVIARAAIDGGADIISLINTVSAMAVDWERRRPCLGNITGGLSGPAIKPIALKMVRDVVTETRAPVIGIGGIMTAEGASAVQVGTFNLIDPAGAAGLADGLTKLLKKRNIKSLRDIIGTLENPV